MENERRKGPQGSTSIRLMDAMAASGERGYTNKEMCDLLKVNTATISGTISEVYQALSKQGRMIREFDDQAGANRYIIEEGITGIEIWDAYRAHMKEKRDDLKRRKAAAGMTPRQLPSDRTADGLVKEVVDGLENLLKRVELIEVREGDMEKRLGEMFEEKISELHKHIDLNAAMDKDDREGETRANPRPSFTPVPERIDIVVDVIVEFKLGGIKFGRGGR